MVSTPQPGLLFYFPQYNMKQFTPVSPSDYSEAEILKAFREGKLFIKEDIHIEETPIEDRILTYVASLDDCTTTPFAGKNQIIWKKIINHPELKNTLMITRGRNQGQIHKYYMLLIASRLLTYKVYDLAQYTTLSLHLKLEHIEKKNAIYTGMNIYVLSKTQRDVIRQICSDMKEKQVI